MSSDADGVPGRGRAGSRHVPVPELARRQGVQPIGSVRELARPALFDSDEDFEELLRDLYACRRADVA